MPKPTDAEPDWDEVVAILREARLKSRGYANYWEWAPDRRLAEVGVGTALADYLTRVEGHSWASVQSISDDPPDVLLLSTSGDRVGVEVTELVDAATVERHRYRQKKLGAHAPYDWASWTRADLSRLLIQAIERKDRKLANRAGEYNELVVAVFTDEPAINPDFAQQALSECSACVDTIQRAFLILSYQPFVDNDVFPNGIPIFPVSLRRA